MVALEPLKFDISGLFVSSSSSKNYLAEAQEWISENNQCLDFCCLPCFKRQHFTNYYIAL